MFKEIPFTDVKENVVDLLKNQWGLVTAGDENGYNTMTVSWGAVGELWAMDMATIYIRPQRYTVNFLENSDYFTITFYPEDYHKALAFCGSKSGKDVDKIKETGLTPVFSENAPYFEEAKLVLVCRKVAKGKFEPEQIIDKSIIDKQYPSNDFHYIYYGAIEKVLISAN
jgi:flavin reductase (DIM6/NTAB) family NADH-FMN oxidoreductase RutF